MKENLNVLLVDDNPHDRGIVRRELRNEFGELNYLEVTNQEALTETLRAGDFDIVITDYQIRWTNGLNVLREVKQLYPYCPVVMFTATGSEEIAVEAMKAGLNDYVIKNLAHIVRLRAAVRAALDHAVVCRRAAFLESRLQTLLTQLQIGVFSCSRDGQFLELNDAMRAILGCEGNESANGLSLASVFPTQLETESFLRQTVAAEIPHQVEIEEIADSGESRIFRVNACRINSVGHQLRIDGLVEDVTERHRAAKQAREAQIAQSQIQLLTRREKQVLAEVVAGAMNKTIARRFDISQKTVECHRSNLMKKLRVRSVAELVRLATQAENAQVENVEAEKS